MNKRAVIISAMICLALSTGSCKKDNDTKNDNVVEKRGLAVSGSQEVPAKTSSASGTLDVSYDKSTKMLTFQIDFQSLTGNPTGAHIHGAAARGSNAGIKYDFHSLFPAATSGRFTNSVLIDGNKIKEDSLLAGFYYVNIHTSANPGGEIRGQIEFK